MDPRHMPVIRPTPFNTMFFGGSDRPEIDMEFGALTCRQNGEHWYVEVSFTLSHEAESFWGRVVWSPVSSVLECHKTSPRSTIKPPQSDLKELPPCLEPAVVDATRRMLVERQLVVGVEEVRRRVMLIASASDSYACDHDTWEDVPE